MPFPMKMFPRATQTREVDVLAEFLMRVHHAIGTGEYGPVEELLDAEVQVRTRVGQVSGIPAAIDFFKVMAQEPYRASIVAPKGGLVTVLISPIRIDGDRRGSREQIYRLRHDKIVEVIDLGRTPQMVNRPLSQPN